MRLQPVIETKLKEALSPVHLEVVNESHMHSVAPGSESHFKVVVVSDRFDGKSLIERQRLVNGLLSQELAGGVHALTMKTLTPAQWEASGQQIDFTSPSCLGGSMNGAARPRRG